MEKTFRVTGIKEKLMKDIVELNGFHEVTDQVLDNVTQPEWREIISKYYPGLIKEGDSISIDLRNEILNIKS
ncbi:hypothetical protein [Petroclostridium sp. X23]|uniref:hypothetical protein n=1 Tax=Petroclostridium sp. X23 TaxID=3045146 RepID=UPI0024AE2692|nr:hypothetical protein [Petroclostridium sp. X23]WHH59349.1 hypothetical protein QKW49_00845 [Petroclostridium sp. X23]